MIGHTVLRVSNTVSQWNYVIVELMDFCCLLVIYNQRVKKHSMPL
ncbi:hypothetical protein BLA29_010904 [Euroglyphus maynei]|uniref:Uncharacterized protein n=1 Tax=Euroglyphus maynei TaxID=6958 RepID=A0A1Y3B6Y0_EURMA|nr:hypothetical protein BLA29_010904 [Euroglyphus maynei]